MTVPLVAALFYAGNHALTRRFLHQHGYTKNTPSASRFCRRLSGLPQGAWQMVFGLLSQVFVEQNREGIYAIDWYPFLVRQNVRINRCHLFPVSKHEALRDYQASKKRYFYGFKVHLVVTKTGQRDAQSTPRASMVTAVFLIYVSITATARLNRSASFRGADILPAFGKVMRAGCPRPERGRKISETRFKLRSRFRES